MHRFIYLFLFYFIPQQLCAQILPKEGCKLNYRLIGFSFPQVKGGDGYKIEIASGNYNSEEAFIKNIINTIDTNANKLIAEVPYFNTEYTWRTVYAGNKSFIQKSDFYHFSTTSFPETDTILKRLRIGQDALKYKDAYVFVDNLKALYDMKGRPIWFLPSIEGSIILPRDLKLTPQGTITCLIGNKAYEINFKGDILWRGPDNVADFANYHHELTRLRNGNYMVLGNEFVFWKLASRDSSLLNFPGYTVIRDSNNDLYERIEFGTIKEYDKHSHLIWSWSCANYFKNSDIYMHRNEQGLLDVDVHENAFFFDENKKTIYISFRNISRILKINYPKGNVVEAYGNTYEPGMTELGNDLFCDQHCIRKSKLGYLYMFNNNDCNAPSPPKIIMMQEPPKGEKTLKKIWEYECNFEHPVITKQTRLRPGGNVIELPDSSIFAQVCGISDVVCIISHDKNLLWSAFPEKWNSTQNKWEMISQYRSSIITDPKDLERLIWNTETTNTN